MEDVNTSRGRNDVFGAGLPWRVLSVTQNTVTTNCELLKAL